jgi:signal transduction histidine kinase
MLSGLAVASILWMLHRFNIRRSAQHLRDRLEERHAERERIARELHDTLLQGVQGLMLSFQAATEQIPSTHPARCKMERALDRADQVLVEARERVNNLRDLNEPALNLIDAFAAVTSELQLEGSTRFTLNSHGTPLPLHPIVGEESYRIGCEAIMNAFRHANAQNVEIRIVYTRHAFQLSVDDNGSGIDPQYLPPNIRPNHWGLHGMLERAEKIGGRLSIQRGAHSGTEIQLTVPALTAYRRIPRRLSQWLRALTQLRP